MSDLAFKSAIELGAMVRGGEIGALELLDYFIQRIEFYDTKLNAVVVRDFERAREAAKAMDGQKEKTGVFAGVLMTVKESYNVAGLKTTWGFPMWRDMVMDHDAEVVRRLKRAGAVIIGKTNVPVMLGDYQSANPIYGVTNNPWDVERGPGGSSGGSAAALAAGLTGMEAGSDIGGSLRNPAHYCGIYSHKPTLGVVPISGHQPPVAQGPGNGVDVAVVGPMSRHAADLETSMALLNGPLPLQQPAWRLELPRADELTLKGLKVAVWPDHQFAPVDGEIKSRVLEVGALLARAGAEVKMDAYPEIDLQAAALTFAYLMQAVNMSGVPDEVYEQNLAAAKQFEPDDQSMAAVMARGAVLSHNDWVNHDRFRVAMRYAWKAFFADIDILLCPIGATTAFLHDHSEPPGARMVQINGEPRPYFEQSFWAGIFGVVGLPSTVFPTGLSQGGLPIGLQAVTGEYQDFKSVAFARLISHELGGFIPPPGFE